jgi:hypothetical protein
MIRRIHTMIALRTIAAATLLCAPAAATAQPIFTTKTVPIYDYPKPTATKPTPRVAALIQALSNASPAKREAAQRSLLKLGPQIEPQLQWALNADEEAVAANDKQNPAIHQTYMRGFGVQRYPPDHVLPRYANHNLSVLISHLDERRHASPSLITLHYTDTPVQTVLRDFGRQLDASISMGVQSGYRVPSESELDWITTARITINVDRANYWSTLQTIMQALPSLAPGNTDEQFLQIGFDRIHLAPSLNSRNPAFNPQASTIAGPLQIAASVTDSTLTLRAAAEPSLTGLNSNATVRIDTITDDLGHSLLPSAKRIFTPADDNRQYIPSDGYRAWTVQIPLEPLEPGRHIATIRGQFGIGTAPPQQPIAIPLPTAPPPSPQEIFVTEDCRILTLPTGDDLPYTTDKNICRRESTRDTSRGKARIEEHTVVLTNINATPVTFVVSQWLFGGVIDSVPKPDQVAADTAIFRAHADPGETVHLHIGIRYDQRTSPRQTPPTPNPTPTNKGQPLNSDTFDGWTLTIKSVIPNGSLYSVNGELSRSIDTPLGYEGIHLYISLADNARWTIVNKDRSVTQRQDGDRLIEDWTVNSAEPGRIPTTLIWDTPEATRWLTAPFELHAVQR